MFSSWGFRIVALAGLMVALGTQAYSNDYLIDLSYGGVEGAPSGRYTGVYKSIVTALNTVSNPLAIPAGPSALEPNRIFIAPGVYNTANVTGVTLVNQRSNIALLGATGNPDDVVITSTLDAAYNPGSGALGTTGSSTLQLRGNNTTAKGITFANSTDTPYIVNVVKKAVTPQGDYTGNAQTVNSQGVALKIQGDQQAFVNCKFLGYQDTLYTDGGRSYFENVLVNGDIDFIFSKGTPVFKNSIINMGGDHNGGTITAASTDKNTSNGIVFLDSEITGNSVRGNPIIDPFNAANVNGPANNNMYLGRPWGWQQAGGDASTVFINTKMDDSIRAVGWLRWNATEEIVANMKNDGDLKRDSRYAEFNSMDSSGNPLNVASRVAWSHQLTADQAADYTVENIFSREGSFAWFGAGYGGSTDPTDPNYSWPAYWGNRNSTNDATGASESIIRAPYPTPGNPSAYSNPRWAIAGNWTPINQIMAAMAPEPASATILAMGIGLCLALRRGKSRR